MGAHFSFLKGARAAASIPKTRNLISVITKVHAQTENGLRQYLKRALREGATPDEVLDALLMAFPASGWPNRLGGRRGSCRTSSPSSRWTVSSPRRRRRPERPGMT